MVDNQQNKISLSHPSFPVPSSLPSKPAHITGSSGDLPPENQHHQIPRMLPYLQELVRDRPLQDQGQGGIHISS